MSSGSGGQQPEMAVGKSPESRERSDPPDDAAAMTLGEAQAAVDRWIRSVGVRYFDELTNLAQLVEEVGEVARVLSRTCGEQSSKPGESHGELSDELADVLFVTICLANQSGIDLESALRRNLDKKTRRDRDRHSRNEKLTGGREGPDSALHD